MNRPRYIRKKARSSWLPMRWFWHDFDGHRPPSPTRGGREGALWLDVGLSISRVLYLTEMRRMPFDWDCSYPQPLAAYPETRDGPPPVDAKPTCFPIWPCSPWGLPIHGCHHPCWWSLTPPFHPYRPACAGVGGILSVALAVGFPRLVVNQHGALWSSDFPPFAYANSDTPKIPHPRPFYPTYTW